VEKEQICGIPEASTEIQQDILREEEQMVEIVENMIEEVTTTLPQQLHLEMDELRSHRELQVHKVVLAEVEDLLTPQVSGDSFSEDGVSSVNLIMQRISYQDSTLNLDEKIEIMSPVIACVKKIAKEEDRTEEMEPVAMVTEMVSMSAALSLYEQVFHAEETIEEPVAVRTTEGEATDMMRVTQLTETEGKTETAEDTGVVCREIDDIVTVFDDSKITERLHYEMFDTEQEAELICKDYSEHLMVEMAETELKTAATEEEITHVAQHRQTMSSDETQTEFEIMLPTIENGLAFPVARDFDQCIETGQSEVKECDVAVAKTAEQTKHITLHVENEGESVSGTTVEMMLPISEDKLDIALLTVDISSQATLPAEVARSSVTSYLQEVETEQAADSVKVVRRAEDENDVTTVVMSAQEVHEAILILPRVTERETTSVLSMRSESDEQDDEVIETLHPVMCEKEFHTEDSKSSVLISEEIKIHMRTDADYVESSTEYGPEEVTPEQLVKEVSDRKTHEKVETMKPQIDKAVTEAVVFSSETEHDADLLTFRHAFDSDDATEGRASSQTTKTASIFEDEIAGELQEDKQQEITKVVRGSSPGIEGKETEITAIGTEAQTSVMFPEDEHLCETQTAGDVVVTMQYSRECIVDETQTSYIAFPVLDEDDAVFDATSVRRAAAFDSASQAVAAPSAVLDATCTVLVDVQPEPYVPYVYSAQDNDSLEHLSVSLVEKSVIGLAHIIETYPSKEDDCTLSLNEELLCDNVTVVFPENVQSSLQSDKVSLGITKTQVVDLTEQSSLFDSISLATVDDDELQRDDNVEQLFPLYTSTAESTAIHMRLSGDSDTLLSIPEKSGFSETVSREQKEADQRLKPAYVHHATLSSREFAADVQAQQIEASAVTRITSDSSYCETISWKQEHAVDSEMEGDADVAAEAVEEAIPAIHTEEDVETSEVVSSETEKLDRDGTEATEFQGNTDDIQICALASVDKADTDIAALQSDSEAKALADLPWDMLSVGLLGDDSTKLATVSGIRSKEDDICRDTAIEGEKSAEHEVSLGDDESELKSRSSVVTRRVQRVSADGSVVERVKCEEVPMSLGPTSLTPYFLAAGDLPSPPDFSPQSAAGGGIKVYTDTVEGEPWTERRVEEVQETRPDGETVTRRVVRVRKRRTIIKHIVIEGPEFEEDEILDEEQKDDATASAAEAVSVGYLRTSADTQTGMFSRECQTIHRRREIDLAADELSAEDDTVVGSEDFSGDGLSVDVETGDTQFLDTEYSHVREKADEVGTTSKVSQLELSDGGDASSQLEARPCSGGESDASGDGAGDGATLDRVDSASSCGDFATGTSCVAARTM